MINKKALQHNVPGTVVSVRGSVVHVRFDEKLPSIYSVLRAGAKQEIVIEVLTQSDPHHVRGIALTPTEGLARGMAVEDTGAALQAPVGKGILSRMFDVFGNAIDQEEMTLPRRHTSAMSASSRSYESPFGRFSECAPRKISKLPA